MADIKTRNYIDNIKCVANVKLGGVSEISKDN